jgi:hypothetical protein
LALFGLAAVLATFKKIWRVFPNHLVTLATVTKIKDKKGLKNVTLFSFHFFFKIVQNWTKNCFRKKRNGTILKVITS